LVRVPIDIAILVGARMVRHEASRTGPVILGRFGEACRQRGMPAHGLADKIA
jgi:hypothetical protein